MGRVLFLPRDPRPLEANERPAGHGGSTGDVPSKQAVKTSRLGEGREKKAQDGIRFIVKTIQ